MERSTAGVPNSPADRTVSAAEGTMPRGCAQPTPVWRIVQLKQKLPHSHITVHDIHETELMGAFARVVPSL